MIDEKFSASPVYQWTLEAGREAGRTEGIAIGKAEGIALGKSQTLAQMRKRVMEIVIEQFSSLIGLTNEIVALINDPDSLFSLGVDLAQAQSIEEAHQILLKAQLAK